MKASEWVPRVNDNYGMLLFLGRSGCGKSGAAASHPGKRFIHDIDYRFGGVGSMIAQKMILSEDLEYEQYPNSAQGFSKFFKNLDKQAVDSVVPNRPNFPAMIQIDSVASFNELLMKYAAAANANVGQTIQFEAGPKIRLTHMGDYRFEINETRDILGKLKSLPCTVIWTGHTIPRWGKKEGADPYADNVILGEMLNARDKFAEDFVSRFDNVFVFDREELNSKMRFTVKFFSNLAKNTFGIGPGAHLITDIPFFVYFKELLKDPKKPTLEIRKVLGL